MVSRTREGSLELLGERLAGALDAIVLKALRKEPEERYPTAAALADDLRRYLAGSRVSAARDAFRYRAVRAVRRHRAAAAVAALMVVAITATALIVRHSAGPDASATRAPAMQPRPSVAVVAFRNLSARPADEWLRPRWPRCSRPSSSGTASSASIPADVVARAARELGEPGAPRPMRRTSGSGRGRRRLSGGWARSRCRPHAVSFAAASTCRVHRAGQAPIAVAGIGRRGAALHARGGAGRELRGHLGLKESSPEATGAARAAYPRTLDATRLYAEGLERLRVLDAVAARERLEQATRASQETRSSRRRSARHGPRSATTAARPKRRKRHSTRPPASTGRTG